MTSRIQKAIIPIAGIGSRLKPITTYIPKELLPYGSNFMPIIWHAIKELEGSFIKEVAVIIRKEKEGVRKYIETNFKGKIKFDFLYQKDPSGVVDALLLAKKFLQGEDALLVFPDQYLENKTPATLQLLQHVNQRGIWNCAVKVSKAEIKYFAGCWKVAFKKRTLKNNGCFLPEKEVHERHLRSPYEWIGFGRSIVPFEMFEELTFFKGEDNEGIRKSYLRIQPYFFEGFVPLKGYPSDLGTIKGYNYYFTKYL